jgi:tRNA(adenine34) deaminase
MLLLTAMTWSPGDGEGAALRPEDLERHQRFMAEALEEARGALDIGEVPIGAVVVQDGEVVGRGFNQPIHAVDPTAHAEIVALRNAAHALGNYRLPEAALYVTVEPCVMCVGAILNARIVLVAYGIHEPKFGAIRSLMRVERLQGNHRFQVVAGVREADCRKLMQDFFKLRREKP